MKCTGCQVCQLVCSFTRQGVISLAQGALTIERFKDGRDVVHACRQCDDPACVAACTVGALSKNEKTGIVELDGKKCIKCMACVRACPYKGIHSFSKEHPPVKCIACGACVSWCADGVLEIREDDGGSDC